MDQSIEHGSDRCTRRAYPPCQSSLAQRDPKARRVGISRSTSLPRLPCSRMSSCIKERRDKGVISQWSRLNARREGCELLEAKTEVEKLEQQLAEARSAKTEGGGKADKGEIKALEKELEEERKKVSWWCDGWEGEALHARGRAQVLEANWYTYAQVPRLEAELVEQTTPRERLQAELAVVQTKLDLLDSTTTIRPHERAALDALKSKLEAKTKKLTASNEKVALLKEQLQKLELEHPTLREEKVTLVAKAETLTARCESQEQLIARDGRLIEKAEELMRATGQDQAGGDLSTEDRQRAIQG